MTAAATEMPSPIAFTDSACNKVRDLIAEEGNPDLKLRVFVTGGGCSGFQYGFTFDEIANEDDTSIERDGVIRGPWPRPLGRYQQVTQHKKHHRGTGGYSREPVRPGSLSPSSAENARHARRFERPRRFLLRRQRRLGEAERPAQIREFSAAARAAGEVRLDLGSSLGRKAAEEIGRESVIAKVFHQSASLEPASRRESSFIARCRRKPTFVTVSPVISAISR